MIILETNIRVQVRYAIEDEPMGTGGAVVNALSLIRDTRTALIVNGDTFFNMDFCDLLNGHEEKDADFSFGLFTNCRLGMDLSILARMEKSLDR